MTPGDQPPPRWPAWYGPAGLGAAFLAITATVAALGLIAGLSSDELKDPPPGFMLGATFVQDVIVALTAVAFAAIRVRPRAWHFGLRRAPFWSSLGWLALAVVAFYAFAAAYTALVEPDGKQRIVEDLGARESMTLLAGSAFLIVAVAPFAEELFFRGFFYGALRTRLPVLAAATLNGLVFGAIHYTGPDTLSILPPLAFLGFTFCLLYERTGSLYPVIAFHALNNAIALSAEVGADNAALPLGVGVLVIGACLVLPQLHRPGSQQPLSSSRPVTSAAP